MAAFASRPIHVTGASIVLRSIKFPSRERCITLYHWFFVFVILSSQVLTTAPVRRLGSQLAFSPLSKTDSDPDKNTFDLHAYRSIEANVANAHDLSALPEATTRQGYPEMVNQRDAYSRHYDLGNGKALAVVTPRPRNGQGAEGEWRAIDGRFAAVEDGFVTRGDTLIASLGQSTSAALLRHAETVVGWKPQALVALDAEGHVMHTLATPQPSVLPDVSLSPAATTLIYAHHWSDPTLRERFDSTPGSLEQSLILAGPPSPTAHQTAELGTQWLSWHAIRWDQLQWQARIWFGLRAPQSLALETNVYLLSGQTLWVNERPQTSNFTTLDDVTQPLEIRDGENKVVMALAPIVAYEGLTREQGNAEVVGHYEGELLEPGIWRLRMVTPWAWWMDPERSYPAVLDPIICGVDDASICVHVHKTNAIESQICFIADGNEFGDPVCEIAEEFVVVGDQFHKYKAKQDGETVELTDHYNMKTTIHFDTLPTLPPGHTISKATLRLDGGVQTNGGGMHGDELRVELFDGETPIDTHLFQHGLNLNEHKSNFDCNITNTNKCRDATMITMTVDIPLPISLVGRWYDGNNNGLGVRMEQGSQCEHVASHTTLDTVVGECSFTSMAQPELILEYDAPTLANEPAWNAPAPSYDPDFFARSANEFELTPINQPWFGVVAGARSADEPNNAAVELNVRTNFDPDRLPVFGDRPIQPSRVNRPTYVVFDNTTNLMAGQTIWVEVNGLHRNEVDATYDLKRVGSHQLPDPTVHGANANVELTRGRLSMFHFQVQPETNLYISVTAQTRLDLALELFPKDPGRDPQDPARSHRQSEFAGSGEGIPENIPWRRSGGMTQYSVETEVKTTAPEEWSLAITHAHQVCGEESSCDFIEIELIACPKGTYFTHRWGCQSLIYPHATIFPETGVHPGVPITAFEDERGVRIFSEGGFDHTPTVAEYGPDAQRYAYCTANENLGMPLLGITDDAVPALPTHGGSQRLIAVRQGSICVTNNGRIEITTGPMELNGAPTDFGVAIGPSFRYNAAFPAPLYDGKIVLFHGEMIKTFGEIAPHNGRMIQDANRPLRLLPVTDPMQEPTATIEHVQPWSKGAEDGRHWPNMATESRIAIGQRAVTGQDHGIITIETDNENATVGVTFDATWEIVADYDVQGFKFSAQTPTMPPNMSMASLEVRPHAAATAITSFKGQNPGRAYVDELHLTDATIHQSVQMGAAYRPIQAVILPATRKRLGGVPCIGGSCLDLRNHQEIHSAEWQMPDVDVGGPTGSVILQSAGHLQLFSNDHPDASKLAAAGVNAPNFAQSFNFKTFSGKVSITKEPCITSDDPAYDNSIEYPDVTVVTGKTSLALPSLGDGSGTGPGMGDGANNPGPGLFASFRLCQDQLRQVALTFKAYPPGIAVGASGMIVHEIAGTVWVNPDFVRIELGVDFQSADGFTFSKGGAQMIVDTRGYFELSGGARLVGVFDLSGSLQVAWNPLDVLQEADLKYRDWFRGYLRMHAWRGQGWQNAYYWLPDNNDFHFTGAIGAELTIKEGRIGQFFGVTLPRDDIIIAVEVSFGEFCRNDACTSYEWGVQGKITILKFTIGMFMGKKSGLDFFVGDRGRTLIDQAFDVQSASVNALPKGLVSDLDDGTVMDFGGATNGPCPEKNGVATCTFTVEPDTGEALIAVTWSQGTLPTALLHTPNGVVISGAEPGASPLQLDTFNGSVQAWAMAAGGDVQFTLDATGAFYTIANPQAGEWTLTLENLTGDEAYNVLFAANSLPPQLTVTAPNNVVIGDAVDIQWTSSAAPEDATVELGYLTADEYAAYTNGLAASGPISTVLSYRTGVPIGPGVPAADGHFTWHPDRLASGVYYIVAHVDHPIYGSTYSFSPGSFTYVDTTPPAAPIGIRMRPEPGQNDGLIVSWQRNGELDLHAYEVIYNSPNLDDPSGFIERRLRVLPGNPQLEHPTRESTRLVGLLEGVETTVCVRAVDASGNLSECSPAVSATPQAARVQRVIAPTMTSLQPAAGGTLSAAWSAGLGSNGYLLTWRYGCSGTYNGSPAYWGPSINANVPQPNRNVGNATSYNLTGLPPGTYFVAVRGYLTEGEARSVIGEVGAYSNSLRTVLSDGVDTDGDHLPDDWATVFGVQGEHQDPDGDRLTNDLEHFYMTDPTNPDSDDDGFIDGEEVLYGHTDPCDANSLPHSDDTAWLVADTGTGEDSLRFETTAGLSPAAAQYIEVGALGHGEIGWNATPSEPWIHVTPNSGEMLSETGNAEFIKVTIDATGLEPGYYAGHVRIVGLRPGTPVFASPQDVPVRVWVLRPAMPMKSIIEGYVFLDENRNGKEDPSETSRVDGVTVHVINAMGAIMATSVSLPNNGVLHFSQLPNATYAVRAERLGYQVTTPNPLPLTLSKGHEIITDLRIGVAPGPVIGPQTDQDNDGIFDINEDLNGDGNLNNDDTDLDGIPNYLDEDDDNDGVPTRTEGVGDSNNDAIPDYLDNNIVGEGISNNAIYLPIIFNGGTQQFATDAAVEATVNKQLKVYLPVVER